MSWLRTWGALGVVLVAVQVGGCPLGGAVALVTQGLRQLEQTVAALQDIDPRDIALPAVLVTSDDTVVIEPDVVVISDIQTQLEPVDLSGDTVLGFVNDSGADLFIEFLADGVLQDVFVFDGDTLLLDYPCLTTIDLLSDIEIDPASEEVIATLDLTGVSFFNPDDFVCGEAVLLTFTPGATAIGVDVIDLLQ